MGSNRVILLDNGYIYRRAMMAFRRVYYPTAPELWASIVVSCLKVLKVTLNDLVIVADDYSSWRKKYYTGYKKQRQEQRDALEDDDWFKEVFGEYNSRVELFKASTPWQFVKKWELEADDWAGIVPKFYNDREVILISSDSDWQQLVNSKYPNVKLFSPVAKKFMGVKNGFQVLQQKIELGDKKDGVMSQGETEQDFNNRKLVKSLLDLPDFVENAVRVELSSLPEKSYNLNAFPYSEIRYRLKALYR
jgi:hypothetical protein